MEKCPPRKKCNYLAITSHYGGGGEVVTVRGRWSNTDCEAAALTNGSHEFREAPPPKLSPPLLTEVFMPFKKQTLLFPQFQNIWILESTLDCFASPWNSAKLHHLTHSERCCFSSPRISLYHWDQDTGTNQKSKKMWNSSIVYSAMCKIAHLARQVGGQSFQRFNSVLTSRDHI